MCAETRGRCLTAIFSPAFFFFFYAKQTHAHTSFASMRIHIHRLRISGANALEGKRRVSLDTSDVASTPARIYSPESYIIPVGRAAANNKLNTQNGEMTCAFRPRYFPSVYYTIVIICKSTSAFPPTSFTRLTAWVTFDTTRYISIFCISFSFISKDKI